EGLQGDLVGRDQEGHRRMGMMGDAHEACQHRRIAHSRIEQPQRRGGWVHELQLAGGATRNRRLLVAGIYEGEILLAVIIEAKRGGTAPSCIELRSRSSTRGARRAG